MSQQHPRRTGWSTRTRFLISGSIAVAAILVGGIVSADRPAPIDAAAVQADFITQRLVDSHRSAIDWSGCGEHLECASIAVPLDWSDPGSSDIDIALMEHEATGTRRGTLVVNPGGPGASGVDFVASGIDGVVSAETAAHFDVIGFDPRGVGHSTAVHCYDAKGMDRFLYGVLPGQVGLPTWVRATEKADRAYAHACAKNSGRLLDEVGTASAARDLDVLRADLGEQKLDYLGYSYGSYLGTIYAGLFPQHVGRFVFDGAEDPWRQSASASSGADDQAEAFEHELDVYLDACVAGDAAATGSTPCPYRGTRFDATTGVSDLLARTQADPLPSRDGRRLTGSTLALAITDALYSPLAWPDLTKALAGAEAGDPSGAFRLADDYNGRSSDGTYLDNSQEAFDAVSCLEDPGDADAGDLKREARSLVKHAPVLGIYEAYGDLLCSQWTTHVDDFPAPVTADGSGPILVVGTTGDPATPFGDAVALARQLANGHLVSFDGDGHTAYDLGHPCVDQAVDSFLAGGSVPARRVRCGA